MRVLLATSLVLALFNPRADAQVGAPWLIVPTTSSEADQAVGGSAAAFHRELWDRGIEVWSPERAAARFEEQGSAPAVRLSDEELLDWEERSRAAIFPLAAGDYAEALDQLAEAQELSRRAPEHLNRDPRRAQQVLDTCLYMVRALQQTGSESLSASLARECRQLVLRGEASKRMHPPEVLLTLERVDQARVKQTGAIRVESEPSGCDVRINGLVFGQTPVEVEALFPGQYRVQVECEPGRPSRVHRANVGFERVDVFVDARFDSVVKTRPFLHLRYANVDAEAQHRLEDAEHLASRLPAGALLLIREIRSDTIELELVRGEPSRQQSLVRVKAGPDGPAAGDLALAARALIEGQCKDFSDPAAPDLPCLREEDAPQAGAPSKRELRLSRRTPRGQWIAGVALASAGSASLVTGYALLLPLKNTAEDWADQVSASSLETASTQQRWLDLRGAILFTSVGGGAALVAAMPLVLPKYEKPPWWAWLSGGLGLGLGAASVALGVTADRAPSSGCESGTLLLDEVRGCVSRGENLSFAFLFGMTAAPALTVPLVYLFRKGDSAVEPSVEVSSRRVYVSLRGRF